MKKFIRELKDALDDLAIWLIFSTPLILFFILAYVYISTLLVDIWVFWYWKYQLLFISIMTIITYFISAFILYLKIRD